MSALARHDAAVVVEQALARVFEPDVVARLREDSPLSALGFGSADAVCIADAVEGAAIAMGADCALQDDDMVTVVTVADLIDAVQRRSGADDGGAL